MPMVDDAGAADAPAMDAAVGDGGPDAMMTNDAGMEAEAGPPPCGAPGETCCSMPMAPCGDGLICTTNTKICAVSDAWALGEYKTYHPQDGFVTELVTAHYDGTSWTLGKPVVTEFGFTTSYAVDIYQLGSAIRVVANKSNIGTMYDWNGVSWGVCKLGNLCVGPTTTNSLWAITSVTNNGNPEFWLAGSNLMYRCPAGASQCTSVTNGITGSWGSGGFAGTTAQDLWYSVFDHVLLFNGTSWSPMTVADARTMGDVGKDDIWIGDKQLRHWDGKAWSNAYLIDGAQAPGLIFSISGSGSQDVFAAGSDGNTTASFAAHWDGSGWKKTTLPAVADIQKIWAPSPVEAFTVGAKSPAANTGMIVHWDGKAWSTMTSPTVTYSGEQQPGALKWISITGRARPRRN
jgi:hypothetical protein